MQLKGQWLYTLLFYYYHGGRSTGRWEGRKEHLTFSSKTSYTGTNGVMSCKDKRQTTTMQSKCVACVLTSIKYW